MTDSPDPGASLRPRLEFAAKAFIVTAFLGVLVAGGVRLARAATASREHRVDLARWTVLERPAWTTLDDVRAIREQSGLGAYYTSVFDTPAIASLDDHLARPANVRRVVSVRRVFPNRIEAVLELRRPAVSVRVPGRSELFVEADEEGVALSRPLAARPVREGRPMRVVLGWKGPVPAPGARFGPDVVAAASLAESLDGYSDEKGRALLAALDRIDVSNYGGRLRPGASEVLLSASPPPAVPKGTPPAPSAAAALSPKCTVEWGRAGDRDLPGDEAPFDAKASRLLQALRLFPGLQGLRTVRVAFDDLVVVPDGSNSPTHLKRALEIDGGVQSK